MNQMMTSARDLDLRQHHGVETPEHVDVRFELAGVGSRVAAGLLDLLLLCLGLLLLWVGCGTIVSDIASPHGMASGGGRPRPGTRGKPGRPGPTGPWEENFVLAALFPGPPKGVAPGGRAALHRRSRAAIRAAHSPPHSGPAGLSRHRVRGRATQ